jgi:nucleotide-binding universal stress UspA family protein
VLDGRQENAMTPITRILVPVDFSAHADRAVEYAVTLAQSFNADIELLHVVEDPFAGGGWGSEVYLSDIDGIRERAMSDATARLEACRAALVAHKVPITASVRMGRPATTILEHAGAVHADLIVMGTRGRTGFAHMIAGSVAERVVRTASCPVLTVGATGAGHETHVAA